MKYTEFRDCICQELLQYHGGLTWSQLREQLDLPYQTPCPEWVKRLEEEIGLTRTPGSGRAFVWRVQQDAASGG